MVAQRSRVPNERKQGGKIEGDEDAVGRRSIEHGGVGLSSDAEPVKVGVAGIVMFGRTRAEHANLGADPSTLAGD